MTLRTQLAQLEANGLVCVAQLQPEVEYFFRHALVQDAAYTSLVKHDRRMLHQAAGEALERLYPAGRLPPALLPLLARHFAEAGDHARAVHYHTQAGDAAMHVYANAEAMHHFGRALELATTHPTAPEIVCALYLKHGRTLELNAREAEALTVYAGLEAWAQAGGYQFALLAALTARATIYVRASVAQNLPLGFSLAQQALALARDLGDPAGEAKALWILLQHSLGMGRFTEAIDYGEQALAVAQAHDLREQRAYVLTDVLKAYFQLAQPERSLAALEEARGLWRELGVLNMLADNLASTSMTYIISGAYALALAQAEEAQRLSRQIGNLWNEAYAYYLVDQVYFDRGDFSQALAVAAQGVALSVQAGFAEGQNQGEFDLALIYGYLGALPRALELVRATQARAEALSGHAFSWQAIDALIPMLYFYQGQLPEAQAALDACPISHDPAELQQQFVLTQLGVIQMQSELALAGGDPARAVTLMAGILSRMRHDGVRLYLPDALCLQGRALHAAGDLSAAQTVLEEARAEALALGSRRTLWDILAALAALAAAQGDAAAAEALRAEALAVVTGLAAQIEADDLRASFLNRPAVRALAQLAGAP
jgi:hypothetical protein